MYACIYCDPDFSCGCAIQSEVVQEVLADLKTPRHLVRVVFLGRHVTKWAKNAYIWPKMTKNVYFGPNLDVFEQKILTLGGGSKRFGTHISENILGTSTALLFGWAPIGRWGQNVQFWPQNFDIQDQSPVHPGLQLSHWAQPEKLFRFRNTSQILGLRSIFEKWRV